MELLGSVYKHAIKSKTVRHAKEVEIKKKNVNVLKKKKNLVMQPSKQWWPASNPSGWINLSEQDIQP